MDAPQTPPVRGAVPRMIVHWAGHYAVRRELALSLAWMESGYQVDLVSGAGARGVMQVMPATWSFVELVLIGAPVAHTTDGNVRVGVAYLGHLLRAYGGSERLALAAYYQGPRSIRVHGVLPITHWYVDAVLALASRVSGERR
jgi:soluble lytic murein transglycosylase-like protein